MNSLAFNMRISHALRGKYQLGLAVLPIGLMFASFFVLWSFASWLSSYLGIPDNAPVKDQPNGIIWIAIFLTVMIVLMITGYLLGWLLNAVTVRAFFGWDADRTRRVFLYSEVPTGWLKYSKNREDHSGIAGNDMWGITRKKGKWNYILTKGVFGWGAFMFFFMAILPLMRRAQQTYSYFLWQVLIWGAAGALFGGIMWYFSEKQYVRKNKDEKP
jgi:hypothetical protein